MEKSYFTFGQNHVHRVSGYTYDADVVVEVKANSHEHARDIMFEAFGDKWSMQYKTCPSLAFFPRGVKEFN